MSSIKLISLNIERSKYLGVVLPFLEREQPDVVCLQELCERDTPRFRSLFGNFVYGHVGNHPADPPEEGAVMTGNGIFSRLPMARTSVEYHAGSLEDAKITTPRILFPNCALVTCELQKDDENFTIGTTHGVWTESGEPTVEQRAAFRNLLPLLERLGQFVLAGDFNAPRGLPGQEGELFGEMARRYKDNIPPEYETSIDIDLHRAGKTQPHELGNKMVDGLFTTPHYRAFNVRLQFGVSDHAAIIATISKA